MANKLYELLLKLRCSKLEYHGDIKPQNIIITSKGLRLIDPGYFGALPCREGMIPNAVITTPAYYPCLEPDDAFAAGAILWELCLGRHPLRFSRAEDGQQQLSSGVQLKQKLKMQELSGRYFYSSICDLLLPQVLDPAISNDLQRLLLSAIGLEYSGKNALELELAPAIPTPQEVLEQIKSVIS